MSDAVHADAPNLQDSVLPKLQFSKIIKESL